MKKITLPERVYYPIDKAAAFLGCDVIDIVHYAATGRAEVCVFMDDSFSDFDVYLPTSKENEQAKVIKQESRYSSFIWNMADSKIKLYGLFSLYGMVLRHLDFIGSVNSQFLYLDTPQCDGSEIVRISLNNVDINIEACDLYVTQTAINKLKDGVWDKEGKAVTSIDAGEAPKTTAKKAELIPALIKLIPDFDDVNLDKIAVSKVTDLLGGIAARKGVELPLMDKNTWARYLGRK